MGGLHRLYKHSIVEFEHLLLRSVVPSALAAPLLRLLGAHIGKNARIHTPLHVHNTPYRHLIIGKNCHVGRDVFLDLSRRICIGDNVTISMRSTLITHFVVGDSPLKYYGYPSDEGDIVIHDGVYMGAGATVLHGVEIGENSLIAAGTLLKTSVPPYSLVAGTPGRVVKKIEALSAPHGDVDGLQPSIRHTV
jgi:acetyltransferase-like isoleucine patch superfamily enzyme